MQATNQVNPSHNPVDHLTEIQAVRERLATALIYIFAFLSLPSVIFGVAKQVTQGYWKFIPFYLVTYAIAVLAAIFNKRLPYRFKAIGGLCVMFFFATGILGKYGLSGAGVWVFTTLCVLATMLFGKQAGMIAVAASMVSIAVVGLLMSSGILYFDPDVLMNSTSLLSWIVAGAWFVVVAVVVVYSPGVLVESLENSFQLLSRRSVEIRNSNEQLRMEIEDRQRKEEALRKSEERYRLLAENAKDVIWTMDMNFRHTFVSPSVRNLSGSTVQEVMDRPLEKHITPESLQRAMAVLAEARKLEERGELTSDLSRTLELEQYNRDGSTLWTEVNLSPLLDANGKMTGIMGVTRDISERKEAEEALRESEVKYRSLVEGTDLGIFIFQDGKLVFANESLREILGTDEEAFSRLNPFDLLDEPSRNEVKAAYQNWLQKIPAQSRFELTVNSLDGEPKSILLRAQPIEYKGRRAIHGVASDVTQQRSLEAQLQQSQKMEAIGRLAGGIAHDFNNLLTGIQGYTEILLDSEGLDEIQRGDLEQIQKASETASRMTQQLLAFSRKQIISPEVVDLNELIGLFQKMLGRLIGEDIDLRYRPGENAGHVKVDAHQIDQVLVNLAINARDAMPDGGTLLIETYSTELDEEACRSLPEREPGPYAVLSVTDTGCGIDTQTQKLIFDPFFTTKDKEKGTGLGLATVYGIVLQNRGMITVESSVGHGTTFDIYLPRVEVTTETPVKSLKPERVTGSETILLVEDEDMLRKLAQRILIMHGYHVLAADSGSAALELHRHAGEEIHLLLTDVVMPQMNGKELYEKIKAVQPDIKFIYMSGHSEDVIARHGVLETGANFLPKPFTIESLTHKVREVLDGEGE